MMRMETPRLLRAAIPAAVLSVLATHAYAQQDERIGNVDVHFQADSAVGTDLGFAVLRPDGVAVGGAIGGALVWACAGDPAGLAAGVYLGRGREDTASVDVAWRFDQDPPDTAGLRLGAAVDLLRNEDTAPFTRRARTAERLTLHVLNGPAAEYAYTLAGVDSALHRLGCGAGAEPGARPAGTVTLLRLLAVVGEDRKTVSGLGVEELPRIRNAATFTRYLERNYPPLMRDAGVTGDVVLRFRVLRDGSVDSASVQVLSSSEEGFDAPSIRSVRVLSFHPARVNGRPVKMWTVLPIRFQPGPESPPGPNPRLRSESRMGLVDFVQGNSPPAMRDACVEGQAVVRFRVQANGQPDPASIEISSSSHELLNDVVIRAVPRLRYEMPPPPAEGQPVNDQVSETIRFLPTPLCWETARGASAGDRP